MATASNPDASADHPASAPPEALAASADTAGALASLKKELGLVTRSEVPSGLNYGDYRQHLRHDFFHSCAYCAIAEAEARAIRFTIDHYEPKVSRPDLENEYENLMYACDVCNTYKGDRCPPPDARSQGHRFFRPDVDVRSEHFESQGIEVGPKTPIGKFTIEALDLNRQALKRVREIRERLIETHQYVIEGIMALRGFPIDELPSEMRSRAVSSIKEAMIVSEDLGDAIDAVLREYASSPLIDPEPGIEDRAKQRSERLKKLEAIYPGSWRGRSAGRRGKEKKKSKR